MSRIEKVNQMLKREIANILRENFPMEEFGLVTITQVETASDLKDATVWVSVLGKSPEEAVEFLNQRSREIKNFLHKRKLTIKYIPNLHFKVDLTAEQAAKVEELLKQIKKREGENK